MKQTVQQAIDGKDTKNRLNSTNNERIARALILSASDVQEADNVVRKYGKDEKGNSLDIEESYNIIEKKIKFIGKIFNGIRVVARCSDNQDDFLRVRSDYYCILSALILQTWR